MYNLAIIGGGAAGYSAAVTARQRDKSVCVIRPKDNQSQLIKAEIVNNYPGMYGKSGKEMLVAFETHAWETGAQIIDGTVRQIFKSGESFLVNIGENFVEAQKLIIAAGVKQPKTLKGEQELLGKGVSYCGTCDGMLYRDKTIAVIAQNEEGLHELDFLSSIAKKIYLSTDKADLNGLPPNIEKVLEPPTAINGSDRVDSVSFGNKKIDVDGVFIFRNMTAYSSLLPELETDGKYIKTDSEMKTNISGIYAAGDCTGAPFQISKAVGEGNIAALSALKY